MAGRIFKSKMTGKTFKYCGSGDCSNLVPVTSRFCNACKARMSEATANENPKPRGRCLKPCNGCGGLVDGTHKIRRTWYCQECYQRIVSSGAKNPWRDPAYLANRKVVLAEEPECWICGEPFTPDNPATVDHVVELAAGGGHERSNLRAAHRACNSRRSANCGRFIR